MKVTEAVCCGTDFHHDAVAHDREAVRQILDVVHVREVDCHFVALVDLEFFQAVRRCVRMHVDTHLVAVADDVGRLLELDAILCRPLARLLPHRVVAFPDADRLDLGPMDDAGVMRFREDRPVVHQLHLIAGNVDQLIVVRLQSRRC